jgi:hypothetical protein
MVKVLDETFSIKDGKIRTLRDKMEAASLSLVVGICSSHSTLL